MCSFVFVQRCVSQSRCPLVSSGRVRHLMYSIKMIRQCVRILAYGKDPSSDGYVKNKLQHTTTHYNTLQHTATHYNTLQHTTTHCNTLQRTATHYSNVHSTIDVTDTHLIKYTHAHSHNSIHKGETHTPPHTQTHPHKHTQLHVHIYTCIYTQAHTNT